MANAAIRSVAQPEIDCLNQLFLGVGSRALRLPMSALVYVASSLTSECIEIKVVNTSR